MSIENIRIRPIERPRLRRDHTSRGKGGQHSVSYGALGDRHLLTIGADARADHDDQVDSDLVEGLQPPDAVIRGPDDTELKLPLIVAGN